MGVIEPASAAVKSLKGLHLYHTGRSNCSGRVRLLIEEKELPWVSHYVDLYTKQNVSADYFSINPKGVVPTLVHDGRVVVESNDILLYLEDLYPVPSFMPQTAADRELLRIWLKRSGDIHIPGIKTFACANLNAALVEKTAEEVARYRKPQRDPDLLAFHAKHDPGRSFSQEDIAAATELLRAALAEISVNIARTGWLVGRDYSLADISWAPTMTTLQRAGFPLGESPHVVSWYGRISQRPAWNRAMTLWQNPTPGRMAEKAPEPMSEANEKVGPH
jgi:glutathione S-transferase